MMTSNRSNGKAHGMRCVNVYAIRILRKAGEECDHN